MFRTIRALGEHDWDWVICYNGLSHQAADKIRRFVGRRPIEVVEQNWADCPIDDDAWSPIREDGTVEVDGRFCGGTLWKVCPPRMRPGAHEVIMDNDLVIFKKPPQFDEFLESNRTMILEEPFRFYGRFDALIPFEDRINSGLMGVPPGYDFGAEIRKAWAENGSHRQITQGDEQGLLMYVLQSHPNIRIPKSHIRELLAQDAPRPFGDEFGYHFTQANRTYNHRSWIKYKQIFQDSIPML